MSDIKVIAHTHWDKEWYFTDHRSLIYSLADFDEIIDYLSENDDIKSFLLDGQTSIIEDYLEFRPEKKEKLIKLIKDKRLITGPWYTQSDTLVIGGENLLRNLLIGMRDSKSLGGYQSIGYLPDSFGMSEQLPLIYSQMGLKYAFFRRGIADHLTKKREYNWISPSGEEIKTFNLYHYGIMAYPPNKDDGSYIDSLVKKLEDFGNFKPYILFNGEDQKPIRKNLPEIIKNSSHHIEISTLEDALDEVFSNINDLENYKGEFTFGQFSRTHKSIFSTRADLKFKHNNLERFLAEVIEPLSSIAYKLGIRYEKELIEKCYKLLLLNSAHDSIGMCNSDKTNYFIENRYDTAFDLSDNLRDLLMRKIGDGIDSKNFSFQIYNTLANRRNAYVSCEIRLPYENFIIKRAGKEIAYDIISKKEDPTILAKSIKEIGVNNESQSSLLKYDKIYKVELIVYDEILPMGYQSYQVIETSEKSKEPKISEDDFIENDYYKISVDEKGQILVKGDSNINKIYFEDNGDEGDSYDYSSPNSDLKISEGQVSNLKVIKGNLFQKLTYDLTRKIPKDLKNRDQKILDTKLQTKVSLVLYKNKKYIEITYKTLNNAIEHRDRLIVDSKIKTDKSIADQQFGTILRDIDYEKFDTWKEDGWDEKPRGIEPMISFAALDSPKTVYAITNGVREYEILDKNKIALTLFRSIPYLGKADLNDRPGRASGVFEIQMGHALLNKKLTSTIYVGDMEDDYFKIHQISKELLTKPIAYQAGEIYDNTDYFVLSKNQTYPESYSLLEAKNAIFSTLKLCQYDDKLILRLYNPYRDRDIDFSLSHKDVEYLKADEITKDDGDFIKACAIKTIKLLWGDKMNKLDQELLQILINEKSYLSSDDLSEKLACSKRTIYNSLDRIKEYLDNNKIAYKLDKIYGKGIFLEVNTSDIKIENIDFDIITDILSKKNLTVRDLMENYYLSYNKLSNMLEEINMDMALYNICIETKQNSGIELIGKEKDINLYKRDLLLEIDDKTYYLEKIYGKTSVNQVQRLANRIIRDLKLDKKINDILLIHLIYLKNLDKFDENFSKQNQKSFYFSYAKKTQEICREFNLDEEKLVIYFIKVYEKINLKDYLLIRDFAKTKAIELIEALKKHFVKIGDPIFDIDEQKITSLKKHLEESFIRLSNDEKINNPLYESIKKNYPYYYNEVIYITDKFNQQNQIKIPKEEVAYIVIYIITIEKTIDKKLKGVIVCNYGVGISWYIQAILEENIKWIKFNKPINISQFYNENYDDYIVFSTLDLVDRDYIKIPETLSEIDFEKITNQINKADYINLFDEDLFFIEDDLPNKKSVINYLADKLEVLLYTTKDYRQSILYRELIATTEIGNGIVLLHGDPAYIKKSSISFLRLKREIFWQEENVNFIILLAVKPSEYEKYNIKDFFSKLHEINKNLFKKINNLEELRELFL